MAAAYRLSDVIQNLGTNTAQYKRSGGDLNDQRAAVQPEMLKWAMADGLDPKNVSFTKENVGSDQERLTFYNGSQVLGSRVVPKDTTNMLMQGLLTFGALVAGGYGLGLTETGAVGAGAGGAAEAAGGFVPANAAGTAGGLGSAGSTAGYQAGLSAGQAAAGGAGLSAAGASGATNAALIDSALGTAGYGASSAGLGGGAGLTAAGTVAAAAPNLAATNPALIESAAGTPGYGLSSAGAGGGAGELAAGSTLGDLAKKYITPGNLSTLARAGLAAGAVGAVGAAAGAGGSADTGGITGQAQQQAQIGTDLLGFAKDELGNARVRQAALDPKFQTLIDSAIASMNTQNQRSGQTWDAYVNDFLPAQQKLAQTALNYDTPGRRAEEEARARAGVLAEATMQNQAQRRTLDRAGVKMDAGRALTLDNANRLNTAKLATGAADTARRGVETTGINLLGAASNVGQGVANTAQGAAGQAVTAGNAAGNTLATQQSTYNATLAPTLQAYGQASNATGQAGNLYGQAGNLQLGKSAQDNAGYAGLGNLAGTLLTAPSDSIIGGLFTSDPKAKKIHGKVSGKKSLADMEDKPVYDYTYKPGKGDGGRHIGRMAGKGDPMGGKAISVQDELGKHHAAIVAISKDVKAMRRQMRTLGDVETKEHA